MDLPPPPPPAIIVADNKLDEYNRADRENKAITKKLGTRSAATYQRPKPPGRVARLDLAPGEKKVFLTPRKSKDWRILSGRLNGKRGMFQVHEQVGPNAYNYYSRGVVVKLRQRNGHMKMVAINTSRKKARVGLRYKRG